MSPTSEPRRKAPRVRARAKASGPSADLRPEVAVALGGLQRSLGDVAEWEHLLPAAGDDGAPGVVLRARVRPQLDAPGVAAAEATSVAIEPVEVEEAPALPTVDAPGPRRRGRRSAAAPASPPAVPPPVSASLALPPLADPEPVVPGGGLDDASLDVTGLALADGGAFPEPNLDLSQLQDAPDPMATWVEHTSSPHRFGLTPEAARRRRNGRIASWSAAVLLVAVAAFLMIPDHSPARPSLVHEDGTTATTEPTTTSSLQFGSQFSVPTLPPTTAAPVVPVTPTTSGSSGSSGSTKHRSTTTTQAPVVTEAPTTTTEVPVPVTTVPPPPPTTTTTIQSCPPVPGQRPGDC